MQADVKGKHATFDWIEGTEKFSDCESSEDEEDEETNANDADSRIDDDDNADGEDNDYCKSAEDVPQIVELEIARNSDFSIVIDNEVNPEESQSSCSDDSIECTSSEFKIVGDNVDKNVRASFQRLDHQTKSLHYFHTFAVRDRVDFSSLSNITPHYVKIDPATLLPQPGDLTALVKELEVIVSRCVLHLVSKATFQIYLIIGFLYNT